ncbi:MAG: hypothetical protein K0R62_7467 [Nonomuraea muscovyensis]|nr:hypothetical protein [Nonomuraea muscovyensis]
MTPGSAANAVPRPNAPSSGPSGGPDTRRSAPAWWRAWSSWEARQVAAVAIDTMPIATAMVSSSAGPAYLSGRRLTCQAPRAGASEGRREVIRSASRETRGTRRSPNMPPVSNASAGPETISGSMPSSPDAVAVTGDP